MAHLKKQKSTGYVIKEQNNSIKLFEDKNIRVAWNEDEENWYFSVVDVVGILTDNDYQKSRNYWKWLKNKLNQEGSELVSNTNQLKMKAYDGKLRDTDVMNTEQILRLVQSSVIKGGNIAKLAREQLEKETGKKVISDKSAKEIRLLNESK